MTKSNTNHPLLLYNTKSSYRRCGPLYIPPQTIKWLSAAFFYFDSFHEHSSSIKTEYWWRLSKLESCFYGKWYSKGENRVLNKKALKFTGFYVRCRSPPLLRLWLLKILEYGGNGICRKIINITLTISGCIPA